ncbi:MAG: hypothetical protein ACRD4Q_08730, partial [Candidatus Acidiferrales bacterium]
EHRLEDLKTEHAQVYVKCREALDDFRRFREEHHRLENKMHSIEEQMSGRRGRLNEALGSRMSEAEYPLAHEVQEYERRVKEAREALREPEKAQSDLLGEINAKAAEMREALDRLKKLRTEQESLRAQIEGRPTPGPFGLQQPPED